VDVLPAGRALPIARPRRNPRCLRHSGGTNRERSPWDGLAWAWRSAHLGVRIGRWHPRFTLSGFGPASPGRRRAGLGARPTSPAGRRRQLWRLRRLEGVAGAQPRGHHGGAVHGGAADARAGPDRGPPRQAEADHSGRPGRGPPRGPGAAPVQLAGARPAVGGGLHLRAYLARDGLRISYVESPRRAAVSLGSEPGSVTASWRGWGSCGGWMRGCAANGRFWSGTSGQPSGWGFGLTWGGHRGRSTPMRAALPSTWKRASATALPCSDRPILRVFGPCARRVCAAPVGYTLSVGMRTMSYQESGLSVAPGMAQGLDPRAGTPGAPPPGSPPGAGVPALAQSPGSHGGLGQAMYRWRSSRAEKERWAFTPLHTTCDPGLCRLRRHVHPGSPGGDPVRSPGGEDQ
jgi:hypothetical protein